MKRGRKQGPTKTQTNIYLTDNARLLLEALAQKHNGVTQSVMVEMLIEEKAKALNVKAPRER